MARGETAGLKLSFIAHTDIAAEAEVAEPRQALWRAGIGTFCVLLQGVGACGELDDRRRRCCGDGCGVGSRESLLQRRNGVCKLVYGEVELLGMRDNGIASMRRGDA